MRPIRLTAQLLTLLLLVVPACEFIDQPGSGGPGGGGPGGPNDPCFRGVGSGTTLVECDGLTYYLTVPDSCPDAGCGLIADIHGSTMSGQMQDNNTEMRRIAPERGFLVFQPNDAATPPASSWSEAEGPMVLAALERVQNSFDVDPARVHLTGFSDGGMMAWELLCDGTGRFASFAPAGASYDPACVPLGETLDVGGCDLGDPTESPDPVDILFMAGRHDALVSLECSDRQAQSVIDRFGLGTGQVVEQGSAYVRTRYQGAGFDFDYLVHDHLSPVALLRGHCYPGSVDAGAEPGQLFSFACQESEFHWGALVVDFFETHTGN